MKRLLLTLILLATSSVVAQAQTGYLWMKEWATYGGTARAEIWNQTNGSWQLDYSLLAGVGNFRAHFGPAWNPSTPAPGPLYCIDVYHTFKWGDQWQATRHTIPPWSEPPPYSVEDAAWIYQTYGKTATTAEMAYGVQLALWEIVHESDWRARWGEGGNWWQTGNLRATSMSSISGRNNATTILGDLFDTTSIEGKRAYYYQPDGSPSGQGTIGDIPEPSTLILLGLGLTAAGVGVIRRRRKA